MARTCAHFQFLQQFYRYGTAYLKPTAIFTVLGALVGFAQVAETGSDKYTIFNRAVYDRQISSQNFQLTNRQRSSWSD